MASPDDVAHARAGPLIRAAAATACKDISRFGLGANYYIHGQNLKWTGQYLRALPQNGSSLKPANEFTVQLQFMYF